MPDVPVGMHEPVHDLIGQRGEVGAVAAVCSCGDETPRQRERSDAVAAHELHVKRARKACGL